MKQTIFKTLVLTAFSALFLLTHSCQRDPLVVPAISDADAEAADVGDLATTDRAVSYTCTSPGLNQWTSCSVPNQNISCGNFIGGTIKMSLTSIQNGKYATFKVVKCNGNTFQKRGTLYIVTDAPCGTAHTYRNFSSNMNQWEEYFNLFHQSGSMKFYGIIVLSSGERYITDPVTVSASGGSGNPAGFGQSSGSYNGVTVYSMGDGKMGFKSNEYNYTNNICVGYKWTCDEFVNRYYLLKYNKNIVLANTTPAHYYTTAAQRGLKAYPVGSGYPQQGDIICYSGGWGGLVGIVKSCTPVYMEIALQNHRHDVIYKQYWNISANPESKSPLGAAYTLQGWLRKL